MWWAAATVHMVGYGEIFPISSTGRLIASISSLVGLLCMAVPLIVVGSNFTASIFVFRYRRIAKVHANDKLGCVMELLEDMNAMAGEQVFSRDDELVFLANRFNSKKKR